MIPSILITLTILLSATGYGLFLPIGNTREHLLIRLGLGLWLIAHLVFLLGVTSLLYRGVLLVVLLAGIAVLSLKCSPFLNLRTLAAHVRPTLPQGQLEWLTVIPIVLLVFLASSAALTPPTARDSLIYHLALPKLYLQGHRWLEIAENIFGYFPGLMEALYTFTLGLGSQHPALIHNAFGLACLGATAVLGRAVGLRREMCLLAVAALVATPTFWAEMTWAYVDLANTFYWTLSAICFVRWQEGRQRSWLVLLGFSVGAALSCKYTSLILLPLVPLGLLLDLRKYGNSDHRHTFFTMSVPLLIALLVFSPWVVRNLILTGNPLYPFFLDFFPSSSPGWDTERARLYQILLTQYGDTDKNMLDYIVAPVRVFLTGQFGSITHYDGQLSFFYLLSWPLLILKRQWSNKTNCLLGVTLIYLVYWSVSSQQARFLLVILPVMAVLAGHFIQTSTSWVVSKISGNRLLKARVKGLTLGVMVAIILFNGRGIVTLYQKENYLDYLAGRKSAHSYLQGKLGYYKVYTHINENLPKNATIFLVKTGNHGYYLDRSYFSDAVFETHTFERILRSSHTSSEMARRLRQKGLTHILIRLDAFLRDRGPLMQEADLKRLHGFLNNHGHLLFKDGPFWLFEITKTEKD